MHGKLKVCQMDYNKFFVALQLITLFHGVWSFKASCLNAESLPSDNLTILQCTEDEVTIEWSIQNDLQFVAFEYSCIHPTNSALNVRNQSFPYWNDGQTGVTTVSPPGGALCLFSACYLDNDNSRHFIAPTSCSVSSPTATQDAPTALAPMGMIVLVLLAVMAAVSATGCLVAIQWKRLHRSKDVRAVCAQIEVPMVTVVDNSDFRLNQLSLHSETSS
eukprot:Em0017g456a